MSDPDDSAARLAALGAKASQLLRLRTLPVAMKLLEAQAGLDLIPKLRRPATGVRFTMCQLMTQCRIGGISLGITAENLLEYGGCSAVPGLRSPQEEDLSGRRMAGVWFETCEAAAAHQAQMPRVPAGRFGAVVLSPLRSARVADPDIVLFYATPAQSILFVNGLQRARYQRYDFTITGESACADSWGRALVTRQTSISIPCYAERRYGGVADDELLIALPPEELERGVAGLEALAAVGLRYPILPYGVSQDPAAGMSVSYSGSAPKA